MAKLAMPSLGPTIVGEGEHGEIRHAHRDERQLVHGGEYAAVPFAAPPETP